MSRQKFTGIFKSFDALRESGVLKVPLAKTGGASEKAFPSKHYHFRSQEVAKRLRDNGAGGYWNAMRDRRYDEAVVASLMKAGISESDVAGFLSSDKGTELGASLYSRIAKTMGLGAHVHRMFSQWQAQPVAKTREPLRKSATEFIGKTGTSEGAKRGWETRKGGGSGAEESPYGEYSNKEDALWNHPDARRVRNELEDGKKKLDKLTDAIRTAPAYELDGLLRQQQAAGRTIDFLKREHERLTTVGKSEAELAKYNPHHDELGRFTTGGAATMRSEGKGAVTETKEFTDREGVERVKLRSTVKGQDIALDMRKDVMNKIRSGELKLNERLNPERWGVWSEEDKRDEFNAAYDYRAAAEMERKHGRDSEPFKLNAELGVALGKAWARIQQAGLFEPGEPMYSALLYKADQILQNAAIPLVEKLKAFRN